MRVGLLAYLMHGGAGYRAAGVSTYVRQLLAHLLAARPDYEYLAFHGRDALPVAGVESVFSPIRTDGPLARIAWEQTGFLVQARRRRVDLIHGTVNALPLLAHVPSVVTVHDLAFIQHPERFPASKRNYLKAIVRATVRKASEIIAVSASTCHDLVELLAVPRERVSIIHPGVDPRFAPLPQGEIERFRLAVLGGRRFILHVGTLEPRKNIEVLIKAYAATRRGGIPHALVLVGANGWGYENIFELTHELGLERDVLFAGYVRPADLPLWYNASDLFAYPSVYEGFGLPVLEAMACGAPTITSSSSSLVELAAEACLTVEPGSEGTLQMAIESVLTDAALRQRMREAGLRRAGDFSWMLTARKTAAVYDRALRSSPE